MHGLTHFKLHCSCQIISFSLYWKDTPKRPDIDTHIFNQFHRIIRFASQLFYTALSIIDPFDGLSLLFPLSRRFANENLLTFTLKQIIPDSPLDPHIADQCLMRDLVKTGRIVP